MTEETKKNPRRDIMKVSARYGMTSTILAAGTLGTGATLTQLAQAAEETDTKRKAVEPKFKLKFGASGFNEKNLDIQKSGQLFFAQDLEDRTDGAIQVEFIGSNQICGQTNCVKKTQQGIVDIYSASTQNSAGGAPYLNVLDFAYMFPSRASQFHFSWMGAVAYAGMAPVVSQCVDLKFFCGTEHTSMSLPVFDKLGSDLQDDVMESACAAQIFTQGINEAALYDIVGATDPQKPGTIFAENNVRVATLSDDELRKAEQMCSPEFVPEPWEKWRERLNKWSGGHDTYKEIFDIASEVPIDLPAVNVKPRRWWKG